MSTLRDILIGGGGLALGRHMNVGHLKDLPAIWSQNLEQQMRGSFHNFFRLVYKYFLVELFNYALCSIGRLFIFLIIILDSILITFRMDVHLFDELLEKVKPYISKENTMMRDSITAHDKLCVTLRFLACGESYTAEICLSYI